MAMSGLFELLKQKMAYLTQRQGVIATNISNAYTPKYKPKDLVSFDAALKETGSGSGIQLAKTNAMHFGGMNGMTGPFKTQTTPDTYEVKPNGNAVVLEQQMTQLAQTSNDYATATSLYHKTMGMLKSAIGRGGGA